MAAFVQAETAKDGADVVFEVSGSAPGAELMTKLGRVRARIVVVADFLFTASAVLIQPMTAANAGQPSANQIQYRRS